MVDFCEGFFFEYGCKILEYVILCMYLHNLKSYFIFLFFFEKGGKRGRGEGNGFRILMASRPPFSYL